MTEKTITSTPQTITGVQYLVVRYAPPTSTVLDIKDVESGDTILSFSHFDIKTSNSDIIHLMPNRTYEISSRGYDGDWVLLFVTPDGSTL